MDTNDKMYLVYLRDEVIKAVFMQKDVVDWFKQNEGLTFKEAKIRKSLENLVSRAVEEAYLTILKT